MLTHSENSTQFVALLRGVNVGGVRITMEKLRACVADLGFSDISTIQASGNVLFSAPAHTTALKAVELLEEKLQQEFNYPARVIVFSRKTVATLLDTYPYSHHPDWHRYLVFFSPTTPSEVIDALLATPTEETVENIQLGTETEFPYFCWQVVKGETLNSTLGKAIAKIPGTKATHFNTTRNINTLDKMR